MASPRTDNVNELILSTTEELLATNKLSDISLATIASTAGISKGTLYYHYKNKTAIFLDLMDHYLDQQFNDLMLWINDITKDTSIHRMAKYVMERDLTTLGMRLHFFYDAYLGDEEIRLRLQTRYREFADAIGHKVAEKTDKVSADYISWLILLLADGLFIQQSIGNNTINYNMFIKKTASYIEFLALHSEELEDY